MVEYIELCDLENTKDAKKVYSFMYHSLSIGGKKGKDPEINYLYFKYHGTEEEITKAKEDLDDAKQEKGYATELKELKGNHSGETIDTAKLKKLAFTQKYANLSLEEIVKLEDLNSTKRKTVESSKKSGKKSTNTVYDFDNIIKTNDEEAMAKIMSNPKSKAEFDKYARRKGI